ncbi:MAG: hypothetical protein MRY21_04400 [Simkaniaceae bacterium]|nr:hypothetical protein [Simkaniaceae bacterium]
MSIKVLTYPELVVDAFIRTGCGVLTEAQKPIRKDLLKIAETQVGLNMLAQLTTSVALCRIHVLFKLNRGDEVAGLCTFKSQTICLIEVHENPEITCYYVKEGDLYHLDRFSRPQVLFHELLHLHFTLFGPLRSPGDKPSNLEYTNSEEELVITGCLGGKRIKHACENQFNIELGRNLRYSHKGVKVGDEDPDFYRLCQVVELESAELVSEYLKKEPYARSLRERSDVIFLRATRNRSIQVPIMLLKHPEFDATKDRHLVENWFFDCLSHESVETISELFALEVVQPYLKPQYADSHFESALDHPDPVIGDSLLTHPWIRSKTLKRFAWVELNFQIKSGPLDFIQRMVKLTCFKPIFIRENALAFAKKALKNPDPSVFPWLTGQLPINSIELQPILEAVWRKLVRGISEDKIPPFNQMKHLVDLGVDRSLLTKEKFDVLCAKSPEYASLIEIPRGKRQRV